ncbi:Histidine protein kinase DivJ [Planctomycetes bacterium Poly30]|uniref:histidine kinase n=1 Tax=Saltatorellus ferox TaxID=2528018 RepID=A0A518EQZ3_9BACT|nr:Histidine protein kinase DivJ [Planctomycetes bacterium Poly30]
MVDSIVPALANQSAATSSAPGPASPGLTPGLTVFSMTEFVPAWALHLDETAPPSKARASTPDLCVVLIDAALLGEHDVDWLMGIEAELGPVIAVGAMTRGGVRVRPRGVRGCVPRSVLTAPAELALDILRDLVDGPGLDSCAMERYMRDAIHEFRTPLTVISEFAGLCQDGIGGPLTERQETYMEYIQAAVDRMGEHFDDFRDGVRMRFGSLVHGSDRGFLPEVVRSAAASMGVGEIDLSSVSGVRLDHVDCDRMTEALRRVMAGARKLSAAGGTISVSAAPSGSDAAEIRVGYRGVVLSEDDVRVMEEGTLMREDGFYRSVARVFGLGISMARLFLMQSGGQLRLEVEPGVGGTFVATVPAELSAEVKLLGTDWAPGARSGAA